ncbi:hypothetical protein MMC11_000759 [Xylographa trunciseda]|nr:hypothetical protein [Xylographa trunciseda]
MASLDIHIEAPAHRTAFARSKDDARFIFNKTIAGHYRNGPTEYTRVGVLLITWKDDDMHLKESEVDRLHAIFKSQFNFETQHFQIPPNKSDTALLAAVTKFADDYNSPDNLMVVYYGGHGYRGTETDQFKLAAKIEADGEGDPKAFFNDTFSCLRLPHTDILLIVDCCYAACAFDTQGLGRRKYELMASAPPDKLVPSAKNNDSFTRRLCDTLEGILSQKKYIKGFPTSELYRRIYHQTSDHIKPFLFDQSDFDFGKIWLRPLAAISELAPSERPHVTIDLTLRLTELPDPAKINELARALQYLPHVDEIKFEKLHAPAEEIQEFFYCMRKAMHIKKFIKIIRLRLERKAMALEKKLEETNHVLGRRSSLRVNVAAHHFQTPDWSNAEAILRDGSKLPVNMATGKMAPCSPDKEFRAPFERPRELKLHSFSRYFSIAWSLDLSSPRRLTSGLPALLPTFYAKKSVDSTELPGGVDHKRHYTLSPMVPAAVAEIEWHMLARQMIFWLSIAVSICSVFYASGIWRANLDFNGEHV